MMAGDYGRYSGRTDAVSSRSLDALDCVVLGAGGFIGTNLCQALDGRVGRLRGLARNRMPASPMGQTELSIGDFSNQKVLREVIGGCDTVFHLIGATTPATGNRNMIADIEANVLKTIRFLDICVEQGVGRVVFASSGGTVYGIPEVIPTPEGARTRPITSYGISKLSIEMYLELYRYHFGLDYRILRFSNPYGPHQTERNEHGVISAFLRRAMSGQAVEVWGDGSVARDFIYIDDAVDALLLSALHDGPSRTFNIGSGRPLSISDLISAIGEVLGHEIDQKFRDARPVDIRCSALEVSLAEEELGWRPKISLEEGLARTVEWMKNGTLDGGECHSE